MTRIALTQRFCDYVEDGCEWVFTPQVWTLDELADHDYSWELTELGQERAEQYLEDSSCGYDLCDGRANGLAQHYTDEQMLMELISTPEFCTEPVDEDFNLYEYLDCVLCLA